MIITTRYIKTVVLNTETKEIVSITDSVEVDDFAPVTKITKQSPKKAAVVVSECDVKLENGKLIISSEVVDKLNAVPGDRIAVNYVDSKGTFIPVISKSSVFGDEASGNKLTKSNTVSYKGKQSSMLEVYGTKFSIEEYKEGIFKLVSGSAPLIQISENELVEDTFETDDQTEVSFLDKIEIKQDENLEEPVNLINFDFSF